MNEDNATLGFPATHFFPRSWHLNYSSASYPE
jgi:hypothetical protein